MKRTPRTAICTLLAAVALTAAATVLPLLPTAAHEPAAQLAQSTTAILEGRAA